jgi:hypothetical protein
MLRRRLKNHTWEELRAHNHRRDCHHHRGFDREPFCSTLRCGGMELRKETLLLADGLQRAGTGIRSGLGGAGISRLLLRAAQDDEKVVQGLPADSLARPLIVPKTRAPTTPGEP